MFEKPTLSDLREAATKLGMNPGEDYLRAVNEIVAPLTGAYAALDAMADELPPVKYLREPGHRPKPDENLLGAWYVKTRVTRRR